MHIVGRKNKSLLLAERKLGGGYRAAMPLWVYLVVVFIQLDCAALAYAELDPPHSTESAAVLFGALARISDPKLSPSGRYIAYKSAGADGFDLRVVRLDLDSAALSIDVTQLLSELNSEPVGDDTDSDQNTIGDTFTQAGNSVRFEDGLKLHSYAWANDERLVLQLRKTIRSATRGWVDVLKLASVGVTGSELVEFAMDRNDQGDFLQFPQVVSWLPNDPDHILAALDDERGMWARPMIHRVNIVTGERELAARNPFGFNRWLADTSGELRIGVRLGTDPAPHQTTYAFLSGRWQQVLDQPYLQAERIDPIAIASAEDLTALGLAIESPVTPPYLIVELGNAPPNQTGRRYVYDLEHNTIIGPQPRSAQQYLAKRLSRRFPGARVEVSSQTSDKRWTLLEVASDKMPPRFYLLDQSETRSVSSKKDKKLRVLTYAYPALKNYDLASMRAVAYQARDGRRIPAYLTVPKRTALDRDDGREKSALLPLVVYPHGGPWSRDQWGFDPYVQFFASAGYAVLQPQYRGSTGFGAEHLEAGYQQWGQAIQDDISDGVQWLAAQGIVDSERVCIVGESFGGYAAAMGLIKTPELYQCAVSINGVMDLDQHNRDLGHSLFPTVGKKMANDGNAIISFSPYHQVNKVRLPLLLIASKKDTVVPVEHSRKMYRRLLGQRKPVNYLEISDGGHWRNNSAHETEKMRVVGEFLARYLDAE